MITGTDAFCLAAGAGLGLNGAANSRAAQAAWEARVNAFLVQGMTYPQAVAFARDSYNQEAQSLGPPRPSIFAALMAIVVMVFCGIVATSGGVIGLVFLALAACGGLSLLIQWRLLQARLRWRRGPEPITRLVSSKPVDRLMIGSH